MNKRKKIILFSMLTVLLGVALVVGGTFALFSHSVTVNNHLEAGELKIGLYRTAYTAHELGATGGTMTDTSDTTRLDLAASDAKLFSAVKSVPTAWYEATLEVSNLGDVAFDYGVKLVWDGTAADAKTNALASQLRITVTVGGAQKGQFLLKDCALPENRIAVGSVLAGGAAQTFQVKAEFINDDSVNNDAQSASIDFDVTVFATQKVD